MAQKVRRDDTVLVTAGKNKGMRGKVRRSLPQEARVVVEGVNIIKRHRKAQPGVSQGGIIEQEAPIAVSNVMVVCPSCDKPTRISFRSLEDGRKVRQCKQCKQTID